MDMATHSWPARLWQRASLMQRLAFVALVPALATAALLVTLLTLRQLANLRQLAHGNAEAIATQAASITVQPLRAMQLRELAQVADSIGDLPHVARVQIRTAAGQILADRHKPDASRAPREILTVVRDVVDRDPSGVVLLGTVLVDVSLHDAIAAQRASLRYALLALLLSLFVTGVIGWQAARWISAPLRHLASAVRQLGQGDRQVAVMVTDHTEIGELQQGFNHAAAALHDVRRGMEQQIEQATQELAHKNAALEAASLARSRFLAAASHDLRQPLYALTLFSSALAVDEHDPQRLDRIAHIQECVQSLDHLFSELLDLTRLETGAVQVEISEFPLDQVFAEVSRNFDMVAEQRGLQLAIHPARLWVRSDRTMLTRILNNLVSNALRFTRHGGALVGTRRTTDGRVRVEVWDTGRGIAPEHLPSVFDEFYRIDDHPDAGLDDGSHSGLGLGLATVQRLAELLDTEVLVKSRLGRGSVFHFLLPIATARTDLPGFDNDSPADLAGKRVLVVDDDPAILSGIRFLLRSWGCEVEVAEDRLQALEAIENWPGPPDIVICDLHLRSGESGIDIFAALDRHYRRDGGTPFARLLVTGETRIDRLREIIAAKIPLLYKPVSPQQLRSTMTSAWTVIHDDK
ncbi:hybrid sensor histidine kinase/response regulator [Rhodanobacter sp. B2A1Ga4]|uniref:ATP-binding response regulator n=1 Tax=Rhodanobacter sp. B2A1Ga4 TaxID=2778647 RepID=UPI001B3786F1|nr:hybrid sensor histidine kinase/response regulator [Rhodanobacter sp. B2A1Ga4]MBQ4854552.1 hybrid sensor histidine kinase/response regulator [Rhodanobacter sp. B2A1Ga4]